MDAAGSSRLGRLGWAGVALCAVLAFALQPLAFAVGSRELMVTTYLYRSGLVSLPPRSVPLNEAQTDPWGRPWRFRAQPQDPDPGADPLTWRWGHYSTGPDGVDQGGYGDDAWPYEWAWGRPECRLLAWSREGLFLLALTAGWLLAHPWRRTPRSPSMRREALRALVIAIPPALAAVAVVMWVARWGPGGHAGDIADAARARLWVPLPVAVSLSALLLLFLLAFALRARAPLPAAQGDAREDAPAPG